jgi:AcrR family transcriptional regulator
MTTTAEQVAGRSHRTQAERTEHTRGLLLDATVACLVELGYSRTSVNEICKRAGVSRGAQQHHFATKAELMAQAIEHLATKLAAGFATEYSAGIGKEAAGLDRTGIGIAIENLWQAYSGDLSTAALELWVAARTDSELRAAMRPVDRALGRSTMRIYAESAGEQLDDDRKQTLFWMTVNLTRGLALEAELGGDEARTRKQLEAWKQIAADFVS